jgi:hypothetical protein
VYFEQGKALLSSEVELADGEEEALAREKMVDAKRLPTRARGGEGGSRSSLDGATRFQLMVGLTGLGESVTPGEVRTGGGSGQLTFLHWTRHDLALELTLAGREFEEVVTRSEVRSGGFVGALFGVRYYPPIAGNIRPFVGGALGPFAHVGDFASPSGAVTGVSSARLGLYAGGGADLFLGRHFTLSMDTGVTKLGSREAQYDLELGFGWTWGR